MRIGYIDHQYPERRNIIGCIQDKNVQYVYIGMSLRNKLRRLHYLIKRVFKIRDSNLYYFYNSKRTDVDIIHTFNDVVDVPGKWCVTFETVFPRTNFILNMGWREDKQLVHTNVNTGNSVRLDSVSSRYLNLCEKENCRAMIALSKNAAQIERCVLHSLGYSDDSVLCKKITVLSPPQKVLINAENFDKKFSHLEKGLQFVFIGREFFRKGGKELVEVLSEFEGKENFHLTVISSLKYVDVATHSSRKDKEQMEKILQEKDWITWKKEIPNAEVLDICREAHVGFLPTIKDSYGYGVLEMQACGCPVVTTDVRALSEINDLNCGWIIPVKKFSISKEAVYNTHEDLMERQEEIRRGLRVCLNEIFANREKIREKGKNCLKRIEEEHNPEEYADTLYSIYKN